VFQKDTILATNTYGSVGENQLTNEARTFYRLDLIKRLLPFLPMFADGQKKTVPAHTGGFGSGQIQWRKFASLAAATTPLTEGVPPVGDNLSISTVTANLSQYGKLLKITDIAANAGIDDVARESKNLLAENAGQSLHQLLITELKNATGTQIANGRAARTDLVATDILNAYEIKKAVRTLHNNKAPRFPDGCYHGLLHPNQVFDLSNDDEWIDVTTQSGGGARDNGPSMLQYGQMGFVGKFHNTLFKMSTDTPSYTGPTSYGALIYGPDFYAMCDFVGMTMNDVNPQSNLGMDVTYIPPGVKDKQDPFGQYGVAGWFCAFVAKILDDGRAVLLHTGATA